MIWVNARRDVHVYAHIQIRKLRIDKRIDESRAACRANTHTRLEAARSYGHAIAHAKLCRLTVHRTNFWILNDLGEGIGQNSVSRCTRQRQAVALCAEML